MAQKPTASGLTRPLTRLGKRFARAREAFHDATLVSQVMKSGDWKSLSGDRLHEITSAFKRTGTAIHRRALREGIRVEFDEATVADVIHVSERFSQRFHDEIIEEFDKSGVPTFIRHIAGQRPRARQIESEVDAWEGVAVHLVALRSVDVAVSAKQLLAYEEIDPFEFAIDDPWAILKKEAADSFVTLNFLRKSGDSRET